MVRETNNSVMSIAVMVNIIYCIELLKYMHIK